VDVGLIGADAEVRVEISVGVIVNSVGVIEDTTAVFTEKIFPVWLQASVPDQNPKIIIATAFLEFIFPP
jgi:hypothetical protein